MMVKHGRKWRDLHSLAFEPNTNRTSCNFEGDEDNQREEEEEEAVELQQHYLCEDDEDEQTTLSQLLPSTRLNSIFPLSSHMARSGITFDTKKRRRLPNFPTKLASSGITLETKKRRRVSKLATERVARGTLKKPKRQKKARVIKYDLCDHIKVDSVVMERALEIQANLTPQFPSFVKLMLRSHVTQGFWLGLPLGFCKLHLPKQDETISLVDEHGEEFKTKLIAYRGGLSGGWRGFSITHKLQEGDVVVFQLVCPCKFKVYVVRANILAEIRDLSLPNLGPCAKENDFEAGKENEIRSCIENQSRPLSPEIIQTGSLTVQTPTVQSEHVSLKATNDFRLSTSFDPKNFNIIVNGLRIDFELSKHVRAKYIELCCTQKSYLHSHLSKKINSTLAAGIIAETVNIADAIQACKLSTPRDEFESWVRNLEAFELLGMDVGFLRARLFQLQSLAFESKEEAESRRYVEAHLERECAEEELKTLESKIFKLIQTKVTVDDEIEALSGSQWRYELKFQEEATAPW